MFQTEYVRNLNCNYERILLDKMPDENKYQYCILSRGGIKGLLPCSLRYINGLAYLYYDITSTQNVAQLYSGKKITRSWMKDFLWSMQQVNQELGRFLLDDRNVLWHPDHIFQDLERNDFYYIYIPYYGAENGFLQLVNFWVENIDYEDDGLVEFVYKAHDQYEFLGAVYLEEQIFQDAVLLEKEERKKVLITERSISRTQDTEDEKTENKKESESLRIIDLTDHKDEEQRINKKGLWYLLENRKKKQKAEREMCRKETQQMVYGYSVAEEKLYEQEDYGKTVYMDEQREEQMNCLFTPEGKIAAKLEKTPFILGKKKEEADFILEDHVASRVHARITCDDGKWYIEDLNSTNGTYKNGLRLQPYEKRLLEPEDEIKMGKIIFIYR